jgi:hypothetical protein
MALHIWNGSECEHEYTSCNSAHLLPVVLEISNVKGTTGR